MGKNITKRNIYNADILIVIEKKYGFTIDYIRKSLRGDRNGVMPDEIKKEYNTLENAAKNAIEKKSNLLK
ncbi:hypothetical protein OMO38_10455 [Chryseobacterium sp. 09-1422]|uniref:Uncharacterized protein n=1 Tax=Chryseobacterium kimseyorum TaxID=2984028 RepID=A0ABT3HYR8_9FLAO|nr:hypothetical protein [Chryseobacterium kimseyorum]MCW3168943.1 hypothetical protein [Chryseobacterium kimseyorum]